MSGTELFLIVCRLGYKVQTYKQGGVANDIDALKDARGFPQIPITIVSEKLPVIDSRLSGGKCKKHKPVKP